MYLQHYGLKRNPFQMTPDTDLVYLSQSHARAKAYMSYSVWKWDGFSVVTGKPGTGKTLMVKSLMSSLDEKVTAVYMNYTRLSSREFLRSLAANFGLSAFAANKAELVHLITTFLNQQFEAGKQVLLVIDEAHYLSRGVLEEIRFFTALEQAKKPLLNIILVGDDSLLNKFEGAGMEQLRQRVRLWYSLTCLDKEGVREYINFRLAMSGREVQGVFTDAAVSLIHSFSDGIPRLINIICDAAMVAAYVKEKEAVNTEHVKTALEELKWEAFSGKSVVQKKLKKLRKATSKAAQPAKKKSYPKLKISNQGDLMAELILDKNCVSIGRADNNDFLFDEEAVCEHHAVINRMNGEYVIEDLDSLNGTYVNGKKIKSHVLEDGDIIGISSYQVRVSFENEFTRADKKLSDIPSAQKKPLTNDNYRRPVIGRLAG